MSARAALTTGALGRRYGHRWALRGVDVEIPAGARVALVGPNGAGTSTLLSLVTGLLPATTGRCGCSSAAVAYLAIRRHT